MKKTIIIVFALLIFCTMSGCRSDDDIYMNYIAIYENEIYDEVKFWYPISNDWEEVSAWVGFEKYVSEPVQYTKNAMFLKNDIDHRFLAYDSKLDDLHFFYKRSESLPTAYSDSVEKVVFAYSPYTKITDSTIILTDDSLMIWKEFFKQCYENKESVVVEKAEHVLSAVNIYFEDLPMFYYYGSMGITKSGKICILSRDFGDGVTDYVVLPEKLSQYILS